MRLPVMLSAVTAGMIQLMLSLLVATAQSSTALQSNASPQTQSSAAIQVNANLVLVDVILSDHGAAVRGLPQAKFRVYENGLPQKITVFEEHKAEDGLRVTAYPPPGPNTYSDFPQYKISSAANVLLLDALNTPLADQMYVRQQMLAYLKDVPPGTRLAVVTLATRLRLMQGFTADANAIAEALSGRGGAQQSAVLDPVTGQELSSQMSDMGAMGTSQSALSSMQQFQADLTAFQTDLRVQMTLDAMKSLARYLSVIPGRKNLIWFSGSFPLAIGPDATLTSPFQAMRNYSDQVRQTDQVLSAARVAVYPVDARGLMSLPSAGAGNNFSMETKGGRRPSAARLPASAAADQQFSTQTAEEHFSMERIAEETGGEAFVNTSGIKDAVARSIADGSHYYTIGYVPSLKESNGAFRKIRVEVEGGYPASYRRGYYADDPAKAGANQQAYPHAMDDAVAHDALPLAEILFKVKIVAADVREVKKQMTRYLLDFAVAPQSLGFSSTPDGVHHARLEFALIAYDRNGKRVNSVDQGVTFALTDTLYNQVMRGGIPVHQEIELPAGPIYLRLVVHDLNNFKIGSTEVALMVARR